MERFKINAFGAACLVLYGAAVVYVFAVVDWDLSDAYRTGRLLGGLARGPLFAAVLGWIAYRLSGRSSRAGNVVLGLVLLLTGFGLVLGLQKGKKDREALESFDRKMAEQRQKGIEIIEKQASGDWEPEDSVQLTDQNIQAMEEVAGKLGGKGGKMLQAGAQAARHIGETAKRYFSSLEQFQEAGGVDASTIGPRADIQKRLDALTVFEKANKAFALAYKNASSQIRAECIRQGQSAEAADRFVKDWERGSRPDLVAKMRDYDRQLCVTYRKLLTFLDSQWGKWKWDPVQEQILFESGSHVKEFNGYVEHISALEAGQRGVQQQLTSYLKSLSK